MGLLRTFRTVRHLTAAQLAWRPVCRGKFVAMETFPDRAYRHFEAAGAGIGAFDFASPRLKETVRHVVQLQRAVHGGFLGGIADGRFTLLNREIDFGGLSRVEWRRELGEKNNRLWRMNLSYMGYLVPFTERQGATAVPVVAALLASMTAQNLWSSRGVFRDVWHPYSVSHRVINLVTAMSLLASAGVVLPPETRKAIEAEIRLGAAFILGNLERDLQFNHLFKNFVCLAVVKAALAAPDRFAEGPLDEVAGSITQQFLADGGHAERAPMYHLLALLDLRILRDSGVLRGASAEAVERTIRGAQQAVEAVVHPDGDVALFNDSWLREAPPAVELTDVIRPRPAAFLKVELPDFGYARLAKDGDGVILDYGPCGPDANPGHAHADFLAFELSVNGVRTVVDPGVPTYSEGEARNVSRSASCHNSPALLGAEPIEFWSSFRVGRRGYAYRLDLGAAFPDAVAGYHDGYAPLGIYPARAVRLLPGRGLLVVDHWQGASEKTARTSFLVARDWQPDAQGCFTRAGAPGSALRFTPLEGGVEAPKPDRYWPRFGLGEDGWRVSASPVSTDGRRSLSVWIGWGSEPPPDDWAALRDALAGALDAALKRHPS